MSQKIEADRTSLASNPSLSVSACATCCSPLRMLAHAARLRYIRSSYLLCCTFLPSTTNTLHLTLPFPACHSLRLPRASISQQTEA